MASSGSIDTAVEELSAKLGFALKLKEEQTVAVKSLLDGKDVLGILPTGFGKSMVYQMFVTASDKMALVISPLNSVIDDQIEEANAMNISALSLSKASPEELRSGEFKLLFASAVNALESKFVNALKDKQSLLHQKIGLVVIDEPHVIVVGNCRFERSTSAFV